MNPISPKFFLEEESGKRSGPFTATEIRALFLSGTLGADTPVYPEDPDAPGVRCEFLIEKLAGASPSPPRQGRIRVWREFSWPFGRLDQLTHVDNYKVLSLAVVGLVPLGIYVIFYDYIQPRWAYWLTGLYFSLLWATFFYHVFPAPRINVLTSTFCFLGTGLVSLSILLLMYRLPPLTYVLRWTISDDLFLRTAGFVFAVGFPEELCKVLMVYVLVKRPDFLLPRTLLFYGMISGLGFGIYEGLDYQFGRNFELAESWGEYFYLNLLRLTSLPVLHATWTGIAGFFFGFARLFPQLKYSLYFTGLAIPSFLHGLYNAYGGSLASLGFALISVLMLILYLARHGELMQLLESHFPPPSPRP